MAIGPSKPMGLDAILQALQQNPSVVGGAQGSPVPLLQGLSQQGQHVFQLQQSDPNMARALSTPMGRNMLQGQIFGGR